MPVSINTPISFLINHIIHNRLIKIAYFKVNRFVLNEDDLQINVISQNYKFFQRVQISNRHQMTSFFPEGDEILDIICKKMTPGLNNGVPQVYVNSIRLNQTNRCFSCLEQKYFFNTSTLIKDSKYDIECRLEVGNARVKTTFLKISKKILTSVLNYNYYI